MEQNNLNKLIFSGHHQQGSFSIFFFSYKFAFYFLSENIRDTVIEVTTPPLRKTVKNGFLQCTALSKRPDVIKNMNNTYTINVDGNFFNLILLETFISSRSRSVTI